MAALVDAFAFCLCRSVLDKTGASNRLHSTGGLAGFFLVSSPFYSRTLAVRVGFFLAGPSSGRHNAVLNGLALWGHFLVRGLCCVIVLKCIFLWRSFVCTFIGAVARCRGIA